MSLRSRLTVARQKAEKIRSISEEDVNEQIQHSNHKNNLRYRLSVARKKSSNVRQLVEEDLSK